MRAGSVLVLGLLAPLIAGTLAACPALVAGRAAAQDKPLALRQAEVAAGKYAVVIGIDDYLSGNITDLRFCESDARAMHDALTGQCGYPQSSVILLLGNAASYENIHNAVSRLANDQIFHDADTVLFYFSGHGANINGANMLVPYDGSAEPELASQRNLSLDWVEQELAHSAFPRQVVLIDACRNLLTTEAKALGSQGFAPAELAAQYAKGMKVILGAEFGELSRENEQLGHGLFTYYILEGLLGSAADSTGLITVGGLEQFVFTRMAEYSRGNLGREQIPVSRGEGSSAIPLAVVAPPGNAPIEPSKPPSVLTPAPQAPAEPGAAWKVIYDNAVRISNTGIREAYDAESGWWYGVGTGLPDLALCVFDDSVSPLFLDLLDCRTGVWRLRQDEMDSFLRQHGNSNRDVTYLTLLANSQSNGGPDPSTYTDCVIGVEGGLIQHEPVGGKHEYHRRRVEKAQVLICCMAGSTPSTLYDSRSLHEHKQSPSSPPMLVARKGAKWRYLYPEDPERATHHIALEIVDFSVVVEKAWFKQRPAGEVDPRILQEGYHRFGFIELHITIKVRTN